MEQIDRYEVDSTGWGGTEYSEHPDGYWVKYKDHERIVKELEERIANYEFANLLRNS